MKSKDVKKPLPSDWKTVDLSKVLVMDLTASISLLTMIRDEPEVFQGCLKVIEAFRQRMLDQEARHEELEKMAKPSSNG